MNYIDIGVDTIVTITDANQSYKNIMNLDDMPYRVLAEPKEAIDKFDIGACAIVFNIIESRLNMTKMEYAVYGNLLQVYGLYSYNIDIKKITPELIEYLMEKAYRNLKKNENLVVMKTVLSESVINSKLINLIKNKVQIEIKNVRFKRIKNLTPITEKEIEMKLNQSESSEEIFIRRTNLYNHETIFQEAIKMSHIVKGKTKNENSWKKWLSLNLIALEYIYKEMLENHMGRVIRENIWGENRETKDNHCWICGCSEEESKMTKEHIIASFLLLGSKAVTVPSCNKCNNYYSKMEKHLKKDIIQKIEHVRSDIHADLLRGREKEDNTRIVKEYVKKAMEKATICINNRLANKYEMVEMKEIKFNFDDEELQDDIKMNYKHGETQIERTLMGKNDGIEIIYMRNKNRISIYIRIYELNYAHIKAEKKH